MKVNSISGITCYVEDLARTAEFYEALGFRRGKVEPDRATFYVNWFFVTFIAQDQEQDAELRKEAETPTRDPACSSTSRSTTSRTSTRPSFRKV
jgi:catechol 2,3-dioxygenase-like lactoylglutathione lyase family enzyme